MEGEQVHQSGSGWSPVYVEDNLAVMSIAFLLESEDDAVIWRGPRKNGLIKQFLRDVDWGDLDYLVIDTPPGTSDEHLSLVQFLADTQVSGCLQSIDNSYLIFKQNLTFQTLLYEMLILDNVLFIKCLTFEARNKQCLGGSITKYNNNFS